MRMSSASIGSPPGGGVVIKTLTVMHGYFMLKTLCLLEILICRKKYDKKAMVSFKLYNVTDWTGLDWTFPISQEVKATRQLNLGSNIIFFLKNHTPNVVEKIIPNPFIYKLKLSISLDQLCEML